MRLEKGALLLLMALLLLIPSPAALAEEEAEPDVAIADGVSAWLAELDLSGWEETLSGLPPSVRALFSQRTARELLLSFSLPEGEAVQVSLLARLKPLFFAELKTAVGKTSLLVALAILSGLCSALSPEGGAQETAALIVRCLGLTAALSLFLSSLRTAGAAVAGAADFLELAYPALVTLLSAIGGTASAALMQSALGAFIAGMTLFVQGTALPLSAVSATLHMIDQLSGKKRIAEMAKLSGKLAKWLIGLVSTLFLGATAIRGIAAAAFDGVTLKTAKYAAASLLPFAGGLVSGTMDTMLGCAALVKTAAGLTGVLLLLALMINPILRLGAAILALRLAAAAAQPVADEKLTALYVAAADGMGLVMATALIAMVCSILMLGMLMGTGGL